MLGCILSLGGKAEAFVTGVCVCTCSVHYIFKLKGLTCLQRQAAIPCSGQTARETQSAHFLMETLLLSFFS